jgi:O-antigen/teichoic acid export membrane protein
MVLATSVGTIAGIVLLCIWARPPKPNFNIPAARDLLHLGVPAASAAASQVCFWNCDYMIVSARLGALQAGYYFRAYTLSVQYQTKVTQLFFSIGFPVLSRVPTADEVEALRRKMVHAVTLPLFPLLAILAIVAPRFVPWFYGSAWSPAVPVVQILTIGGATMCVASALGVAMLANGRPRAIMRWGWGHFAVYACSVFALTRFGIAAVAVGAAVVHTAFLLICYLLLVRGSAIQAAKHLGKDLLPALASCIGLAVVALPASVIASRLQLPTLPSLVGVAIAGAIGYLIVLRACFWHAFVDLLPLARRVLPAKTVTFVARFAPRRAHSVA